MPIFARRFQWLLNSQGETYVSQQSTNNKYTRGIAEWVAGLEYDAIPKEVTHRIKLLILDALGCGLYGAHLEWSRILQQTLQSVDQTSGSCVWGTHQQPIVR